MTRLEISLLGPTRLSLADQPIQAKLADKAVALLAYLALEVQIAQQRDALAGLLWPEQSNAAARRSLRQAVFKLHQVLPTDALLSTRQTLELNPQTGYRVDVVTFIDHLTACRNHSHAERQSCPTCQARLREAVALYRGDFLAQIYLPDCATFEAWALLKREWLRHEVLQALSDLATSAQAKADYETAYKYAWRQLELDPLHEVAHRQLIRSLAGQGRRSEALAQYQKCCDLLAAELGVEPAVETTTLYKQISDGAIVNGTVAATNQQKSAPLPQVAITLTSPSHKLPLAPTPFIGRQTELQILTELIAKQDVRLITIVGAGGMGKTRLALAAGELELSYDRFANGVYFISLAPLSAPDQLVPAVAEALNFNFYEGDSPRQQLLNYLGQKRMLLILDNIEHLLQTAEPDGFSAIDLIAAILQHAPQVKILTTARERLNMRQEQLFPIQGLPIPAQTSVQAVMMADAAQLFRQSARRIQPDFEVEANDVDHLIEICRLVEGMPLGLELAATWVDLVSMAEIATEIRRSLDFLTTEKRDVPDRHRSMRAVFESTWQRLTEQEQAAFARLSIFRGGFTRDAAQVVAGATLPVLAALASKSLLHYQVGQERYAIHELLRQYGEAQLASASAGAVDARDRHSAYYCAFLHQREADLKGPRQQEALAEIKTEGENIQTAWQRAVVQQQIENLGQALEGLGLFLLYQGRIDEGAWLCQQALASLSQPKSAESAAGRPGFRFAAYERLQIRLLISLSMFLRNLGQVEAAGRALRQVEDLLSSEPLRKLDTRPAQAQLWLEQAEVILNANTITAMELSEQSLDLGRTLNDRWHEARALNLLGLAAGIAGHLDRAWQVHQDGLALWQTLGDPRGIARAYHRLSIVATHQGRFHMVTKLLELSLALSRQIEDRGQVPSTLHQLSVSLIFDGNYTDGLSFLRESVAIYDDLGISNYGVELVMFGIALTHLGDYDKASDYSLIALRHAQESNDLRRVGFVKMNLGWIALAKDQNQAAKSFVQESIVIFRETKAMLGLSQTLGTMGYVALRLNDAQAQDYFHESLKITVETKLIVPQTTNLVGVALLLLARGEVERAVELYALALQYRRVANSAWYQVVAGQYIAAAAETLPPEVIAAAEARGQARDLWETAAELLAEFDAVVRPY